MCGARGSILSSYGLVALCPALKLRDPHEEAPANAANLAIQGISSSAAAPAVRTPSSATRRRRTRLTYAARQWRATLGVHLATISRLQKPHLPEAVPRCG
jgi:hypothetical protein